MSIYWNYTIAQALASTYPIFMSTATILYTYRIYIVKYYLANTGIILVNIH